MERFIIKCKTLNRYVDKDLLLCDKRDEAYQFDNKRVALMTSDTLVRIFQAACIVETIYVQQFVIKNLYGYIDKGGFITKDFTKAALFDTYYLAQSLAKRWNSMKDGTTYSVVEV
jgi:hypothetical protein